MNAGELEFFATQDLIDELLRRTTFQGVVVHAVEGAKIAIGTENAAFRYISLMTVFFLYFFAVSHNANLRTEEAGRLLNVISEYIASRE